MILLLGTCYFCLLITFNEDKVIMNPLKKLMGETVIYGFSTILGRFINWLLVPLYTRVLSPVDNGIFTNLMGYVALLVVLLTYGKKRGSSALQLKIIKTGCFQPY